MESQLTQKLEQVVNEIRGTWRYRWTALLVAWVAATLGWFATYWIPNTYEAQTRVFVDSSTALRPLLEGLAIDSGVQSQLDLVRRSLLSKPNLEKVARETGLLERATTPQEEEWLIEQLGEDIRITSEVSRGNDDLYTMSFTDVNRDKSIEVVSRLLESFMGDVIGSKAQGQESAQRFLREQIADYERRLYEAETRLADFKKKNLGLVPGERGDYFTRLQAEQDELDRSRSELQLLLRRQDQLSQQLSGEVPFIAEPGRDNEQADTTVGRLRDAETRLQELLLRFTEKHPEVVALRETIVQLRGRYDRELASLRNGESLDGSSIPRSSNPVYQRIQVSLNEVEVEIAALQTDILGRERRIADLAEAVGYRARSRGRVRAPEPRLRRYPRAIRLAGSAPRNGADFRDGGRNGALRGHRPAEFADLAGRSEPHAAAGGIAVFRTCCRCRRRVRQERGQPRILRAQPAVYSYRQTGARRHRLCVPYRGARTNDARQAVVGRGDGRFGRRIHRGGHLGRRGVSMVTATRWSRVVSE